MSNKILNLSLIISIIFLFVSCGKDENKPANEDPILISSDASLFVTAPGPVYAFNLSIDSAIPPAGVYVDYSVVGEIDGVEYFRGGRLQVNAQKLTLRVQSLPRQKICVVTVKVVSKGNSNNSAQTSFRVTYK